LPSSMANRFHFAKSGDTLSIFCIRRARAILAV
jgi:hypothetical protein